MNGFRDALLIAWLATIGADRVDLLAGAGGFILTPFLALTPLVLIAEGTRVVMRNGEFVATPQARRYALVIATFLSVVLLSVFFSYDIEISAQRFALLAVQVVSTLLVAVLLSDREPGALNKVLVRGAYAGLCIAILFNIAQVTVLFTRSFDIHGPDTYVDIMPKLYGLLPRLSGPSLDMNRGGFVVLVYLFLLMRLARPSRLRALLVALATVSLVGTLSRSVLLAVVGTVGATILTQGGIRVSERRTMAAVLGAAAVALVLLLAPAAVEGMGRLAEPLSQRFTLSEGSTSEHFAVMERALEVSTTNLKQALLGVGYGNAYSVLQDFYPGNPYGNFHSLYLTLLGESGVFALGLGLLLLIYPVARGGWLQPLIVGIILFNVFYQLIAEPIFWFVLALAWISAGKGTDEGREDRVEIDHSVAEQPRNPLPYSMRYSFLVLVAALPFTACSDLTSLGYDYASIEVEAVRTNGEPIPGVELLLYSGSRHMAYGETGADGKHVFPYISHFGSFGVRAQPPEDYHLERGRGLSYMDGLGFDKGERESISFTFRKIGPGTIHVAAVDTTGEAVEGTPVLLYTGQGIVETGLTDATGTHTFESVPFGEYGVRVLDSEAYVTTHGRGLNYVDGILVEEGSVDSFSFVLRRNSGSISVVVTGTAGEPIPGTELILYDGTRVHRTVITDSTGTHRFEDVPSGNYGVRATPPEGYLLPRGPGERYIDGIQVQPGSEHEISFTFVRSTGRIRVRVTDPAGAPIAGASLVLYDHLQVYENGTTDADGEFVFEAVKPGNYGVRARPPDGYVVPDVRQRSIDGIIVEPESDHSIAFVFEPE